MYKNTYTHVYVRLRGLLKQGKDLLYLFSEKLHIAHIAHMLLRMRTAPIHTCKLLTFAF